MCLPCQGQCIPGKRLLAFDFAVFAFAFACGSGTRTRSSHIGCCNLNRHRPGSPGDETAFELPEDDSEEEDRDERESSAWKAHAQPRAAGVKAMQVLSFLTPKSHRRKKTHSCQWYNGCTDSVCVQLLLITLCVSSVFATLRHAALRNQTREAAWLGQSVLRRHLLVFGFGVT